MITKPQEHDINRAGKRLLREAVEPLGWVVNDVQEDYGIDSNVQVFAETSPTGAWFHVQLKSSENSEFAADRSFVSQELSFDHARHYATEMRQPVFVVHADLTSRKAYWYSPQLDCRLRKVLEGATTKSVTVRIPATQSLPSTAPALLTDLNKIRLLLATRELASASPQRFGETLRHFPDQVALHRAFQEKGDALRLQRAGAFYEEGDFDQARARAAAVLNDPDSAVEAKFQAEIQLEVIDYHQTLHSGKPEAELPKIILAHAKELQRLTAGGPKHLKFYALIARNAAELELLVQDYSGLFMAVQQHLLYGGNPVIALGLYGRKSEITRRIGAKYNRCVRLARYAANYSDRWALGRALTTIANAIARYILTLGSEGDIDAQRAFERSALQVCKLAAWIGGETGDPAAVVMAIMGALLTVRSEDSDAYRWASQVAENLYDPGIREDAKLRIERAAKRWRGEPIEGDYHGDTIWQIIEKMAATLGISLSDENDPLVRGLRIAARDNSPERVLTKCEHLVVSDGAIGPVARRIHRLFNIGTAGSKVIHCTLHDYHKEGKDLDSAFDIFRQSHCDSCPDKKPRPGKWEYTDQARQEIERRNYAFVARLSGTQYGRRFTDTD